MSDSFASGMEAARGTYMLEIGEIIDNKYRILYEVGHGGMSRVYLAINEAAGKEWAVKEVRKKGKHDGENVKQDPVTETSILKKLSSPHLPQIIDVIERDDSYLIVMDYIEGVTLKKKLDGEGRQPQAEVVGWALQLCDVLEYLHAQDPPIIYRDMKPGNVMLRPDGRIMLIDFGIAREYKSGAAEDTRTLGTKGYAAPEQYGGQGQTDERTDIYNLGATIYHLVTGKDPTKPPYEMRPIRQWDPSFSTGLEAIIVKCTQNDPEKRYRSAGELRYALENYRKLETRYQEEKRKKWKVFTALSAMGLACILCGTVLRGYAAALRSGTYEALIREAEMSTDEGQAVARYEDAVKTKPSDVKAYSALLNDIYLSDGVFSREEAEAMTRLLGYKGSRDAHTVEERLRGNKDAYGRFCYEMGLAYFYFYEESGNKQLSRPWLREAKETLSDEKKRRRAERLCRVSEYYAGLGNRNKAGDSTADYADYWEDLVKLSGDHIAEEDNIRTALVMYGELVYQAGAHAMEFRDAGVSRQAVLYELKRVERIVTEQVIGSPGYSEEEYGGKTDEILRNITAARNVLETVYAAGEGATG